MNSHYETIKQALELALRTSYSEYNNKEFIDALSKLESMKHKMNNHTGFLTIGG